MNVINSVSTGVVLDAIQLLFSVVAGIVCYFWIRPADKKFQVLQATLQQQSDKIDTIRSLVLDAGIQHQIERHRKIVEECLLVHNAFRKIMTYSLALKLAESLKDFREIKKMGGRSQTQKTFFELFIQEWLPDNWTKDPIFEKVDEAELFVSDRIWELYSLGQTLLIMFQMQLKELIFEIDESYVKLDALKLQIGKVFPSEVEFFEKYGTSWYYALLMRIHGELHREIKAVIKQIPIDQVPFESLNTIAEDLALSKYGKASIAIPEQLKRN